MDSDILAISDFSDELSSDLNGYTGFFSCFPICFKDEEKTLPESSPGIFGRHHLTKEGICLGGTYLAIYDNQILTQVIQSTGVDFGRYWWSDIPKQCQDALTGMGLKKEWYDTGKVLNLLLVAQGEFLVFKETLSLQHIGGISVISRASRKSHRKRPLSRRLWEKLIDRSAPGMRVRPKRRAKGFPATEAGRMITSRKRIYAHYFARVLQALFENRPLPVRPNIGETEIEKRVDQLTGYIANLYLEYQYTVQGGKLPFRSAPVMEHGVTYRRGQERAVCDKMEHELFEELGIDDPDLGFYAVSSSAAPSEIVSHLAELIEVDFTDEPLIWVDHLGEEQMLARTVLNLVTPRQHRALLALTRMILPEATEVLRRWTPPGMTLIPASSFNMGSTGSSFEGLVHRVWVDAFWIDRYPVTNAQWAAFLKAKGWNRREFWTEAGWAWRKEASSEPDLWDRYRQKRDHPVRGICWYESLAHARWAGKTLLSEAQWEKAARSNDERWYPWGDEFDKDKANTSESGIGNTTPVGKYSPFGDSPYGVADMAGNVWEWCRSLYVPYPYDPADGREVLGGGQTRVMRGGSVRSEFSARSSYRLVGSPCFRDWYCGVRMGVEAAWSSLRPRVGGYKLKG
jgi:formylglycine-generating enzyme required for sulfatase activity